MTTIFDLLGGGAGWQQTDRLLHLATCQPGLIAETARIDEALGPVTEHAGFRIELTVLTTDAQQSLTALLGQPARLDLQTGLSRTLLRPFHGHITEVVRLGANGGFARYRLLIEPWLSFLGHRCDNYLFQDKSVINIVDELLDDWKGQGQLAPDWRWDLADASVYPRRGMTVQYQESDLAFVQRLLAEEGLFCWFEHQTAADDTLGRHTLVIADHNGAFTDNRQPRIRYTQAGATLGEDSLERWHGRRQIDTAEINASSWDYRSHSTRPQSASSSLATGAMPNTVAWHDPGQYAWPSAADGERRLTRQRQAIDARMKQYDGEGTVRTAAPGTTFTLADHPEHERDTAEHSRFLITAVTHGARNNLNEVLPGLLDALDPPAADPALTFAKDSDFYRNRITALRANTAWRPAGGPGGRRPAGTGTLTAVVVGAGGPTHSDRDGRVRVQFPWQRGSQSGSRTAHPAGDDNAPASDALGVWLRVLAPVAGANWGGQLTPRPGQEVVIAFQNGNIDRPVIVGCVYNGQGSPDAAGNRIGAGTQQVSANAPAFFAGQDDETQTHGASLSGLKSQQLDSTRSGQGGFNQLIFDDTPGEGRLELVTTEHRSGLQLGHLKQQTDNARHADRGHGGELATQAAAALRAGSGLLLSADARPNARSDQLDSREPLTQTQTAHSLTASLANVAQKQNAGLQGESGAEQLPAINALQHAVEVMGATASRGAAAPGAGDFKATHGGAGTIAAWSSPRLQYCAPGGIAQLTPQNHILVAGQNFSIASGHDTNLIAQANHSLAVKEGLVLFTVGKAQGSKPNAETGIHLHAASGKVSLQSQSGKTMAAANRKVTIASTAGRLSASAKTHLLATAQGAYLKIEGGEIQLHAPRQVELKASQKNLTGPKAAAVELPSSVAAGDLNLGHKEVIERSSYSQRVNVAGLVGGDPESQSLYANLRYEAYNEQGQKIADGQLSADGTTDAIRTRQSEKVKVVITQGDWLFFQDVNHL